MSAQEKFFCSHHALEQGVPVVGSATYGDVWFLLEYSDRWGKKAFEESSLAQEIKDHLKEAAHPDHPIRILLIRQPQSRLRGGVRFFVVQNFLSPPRMYEYDLEDYDDLLELDLKTLAAGEEGDPAHLRTEPLYLVCTNGKRDQCCALFGPAVYQAMAGMAGDAVWQSSHIGGHNLAPVTLFFPHGLHYGRTQPQEIGGVMRAYQQGRVTLPFYRGRTHLPQHVQAAEHFWREQTGVLDLDTVQIGKMEALGDNEWRVEVGLAGQTPEWVHVRLTLSEQEIPITCTQAKTAPVRMFERVS